MNSTQFSEFAKVAERIANGIAQTEVLQYLEQQVNAIARLPRQIQTPQRRAKLHDKQRIRRKDAKEWALRRSGCSSTAEVKKYLKVLGKKLDLRLTSAWIAVNKEFADEIKQLKSADMFSVGDARRKSALAVSRPYCADIGLILKNILQEPPILHRGRHL